MEAMLFAAGLGTRLFPLTKDKPKALVEVNGKPLIWYAINYLQSFGVDRIIINLHHFAEQIKEYCSKEQFKAELVFSHEKKQLLDTGGGLKYASSLFSENQDIIILNVDILTDIDLNAMLECHKANNNLVTLATADRKGSRKLLFDSTYKLTGWKDYKTGKSIQTANFDKTVYEASFTGVHIVSSKLFSLMSEKDIFSIIHLYLDICESNRVAAFNVDYTYWFDVGTVQKRKLADDFFKKLFK